MKLSVNFELLFSLSVWFNRVEIYASVTGRPCGSVSWIEVQIAFAQM